MPPPYARSHDLPLLELPRKIHGGVLEDRVRPPQLGALLSEPLQLFGSSVVSRSRRRPLSGLGLPHPVAQRRHPSAVRPDAWAWSFVVSVRPSRKRLRRFDRCGPRRCSRPRTSDGLALPGSWRVAYDDVDVAGRYLVALLEKALGRRNPDLCRYAVRAMEAANPNDLLPERVRLSSARARRGIPILAGPHGRGRRLAGTVAWLGRRFSCPSLP